MRKTGTRRKNSSNSLAFASAIPSSWTAGDAVFYAAFRKGIILQVMPLSNDTMLKITFDDVGTRMLMANTAVAHLKKL